MQNIDNFLTRDEQSKRANHSQQLFKSHLFAIAPKRPQRQVPSLGVAYGMSPNYRAPGRPRSMAPPRCFNRQDDIFLFFSNSLPLSPSLPLALPPSLSFFLFFFYLFFTPSVPLCFKGKVFCVCTLLADPTVSGS